MKIFNTLIVAELILLLFMPRFFISESHGGQSDPALDCEARCAGMDEGSRHRCMETCINAKRKNEPIRKNDVKGRMAACEDDCADYTGVDRIKCIRICLDKRRGHGVAKRDALQKEDGSPCENRCAVLSGASKDKCMLRCQRESRFKKRE